MLRDDLVWIWEAFWELSSCRPQGMSVGPIPWTAIHEYMDAKEIAHAERFERLVRAMDAEVLRNHRDRQNREQ
jgi:hypothetical protein